MASLNKVFLFLCITAGVIITPAMNLSARENCGKLSVAVMTDLEENLRDDGTWNEIYRGVISALSGDKKIGKTVPVSELTISDNKKCNDLNCITGLCVRNGIDYLLTVRVRKKTAVKMEDVNKYLMKKDSGTVYSVSVRITDLAAKKSKQVFSDNSITSGTAKSSVKKIRGSLNKYFNAVKLCADEKQSDDPGILTWYGISVSGMYMKPSGSSQDVADAGYGMDIRLSSYAMDIKGFNLAIDLGAAYLIPAEERIDSAYFFSGQILIGYSFGITEKFSIMPFIGTGYIFHLIDGQKKGSETNSSDFYFNPAISAGFELSYKVVQGSSIVLSPSYACFFEQNNTGMYLVISAGYRYEF